MKTLIPIILFVFSFSAFAQPNGKMKERIKAQKIAFITEQLDLTPDEAEKFWPIYNKFEATTDKVRSEDLRTIKREMRDNPNLSDKEADALLQQLMNAENKMHEAKLKLVNDLKKVIPSLKIIRLKAAEDEFNRRLLDRLKDMRQNRPKRN
ncbi:sensor of ECF-type sigma factor [uncultured Psychroserpens sp.]|uniref:Spy/CpxP family protein refolding chaperone n=1 Tax=uncultured Psychroserpens sp. TaxID=255436 RepID=UPI00261D74B2|nr:sensor of ECF-type sigma factor [uncultured Psychroserpens sp.]